MSDCPMCPGSGVFLGRLGTLDHFSCRDCGWQFSVKADDDEDDGFHRAAAEMGGDPDFHEPNDGEGYFEGRVSDTYRD